MQPVNKKAHKRRYLGLILVTVILLMMLPTINLVKSYQTLQSRRTLQVKYDKKSAQLDQQLVIKKANITKLQDPLFIEKYARAKFSYSKQDEKVFPIPDLSDGGVTDIK